MRSAFLHKNKYANELTDLIFPLCLAAQMLRDDFLEWPNKKGLDFHRLCGMLNYSIIDVDG